MHNGDRGYPPPVYFPQVEVFETSRSSQSSGANGDVAEGLKMDKVYIMLAALLSVFNIDFLNAE